MHWAPPTSSNRHAGLSLRSRWSGRTTRGLVELATKITNKGKPDGFDYSYRGYPNTGVLARHPHDDRVWLGGVGALRSLPEAVDAIVSLCRVGDGELPAGVKHFDVRLIDRPGENTNLDFVLLDTVRIVEQLRDDGRTVLIHCVEARSRTPAIGALYGARRSGIDIDEAINDVRAALPDTNPINDFRKALRRLHPGAASP